jgi:hypothetical protein
MEQPSRDDSLSPEETARRRDAALRRALNTPPQPKIAKDSDSPGKAKAPRADTKKK